MNQSTEILNELRSISPFLASIERINVFEVPDGYFNDLCDRITTYTLLKDEEINFSKNETLQVPEGYFDTLSDHILAKIKSGEAEDVNQELKTLSPVLFLLKGKNVFTVPLDYFENISDKVISKLNRKPAKIISISKAKNWWKFVAAAVLTGAIAISSLQIFNSSPNMQKSNSVVTESGSLPGYIQSSFQYKTPEQVDEGIATLSDDEIIKYLEKHGNILDNEILLNGVDTKELPATTDYLTDDNALSNYLNKIDDKNPDKTTR